MAQTPFSKPVAVDQIFLDLSNPRHEPCDTEGEVIEYLCRNEDILPLAKDIVDNGLNPIEPFALLADGQTFIVAEGNRRVCALKPLSDPDRAPAKLSNSFEALADGWAGIPTVPAVIFPDRPSVKPWLTRIHDGQQGGIGRKKWSADQSQRHSGSDKNKIALAVLDYAEEAGLISADDRKGKLTTVQRYVSKKPVQEAMGLDVTDLDNIRKTKPKPDFDKVLVKFIGDLGSGHVNSRSKGKEMFEAYGRELSAIEQLGKPSIKAEPLSKPAPEKPAKPVRRRVKPKPRTTLPFEHEIMDALKELDSQKLINLYDSITSVPLTPHAPLVSIGAWAFIESLSGLAGRNANTPFTSFFSTHRLQRYGLDTGKGNKALFGALESIARSGDVTKHHGTGANFNGEQTVNDMDTLKKLILKTIEDAANQAS
ncbi:hypothetical protein QWY75_12775 [Pontixanthobacter aestiaquae]|uniref:ParB/Sulfiredoxin domain-containing protein n=1 Tax=Pontixanthobacter aestiaquae TaxID=1509367 RepID=A0A844Z371_9SPHN|nr:hypothetical protein [Pontixanthobacter aestiaquae]MDN3647078.1 hypothetical protein [Pontixanthobacter aestiaquae]MXO81944.1 hypothetical protein [Pontixanthobacter aestiaquae]